MNTDRIIGIAESNGWTATIENKTHEAITFEFSKMTPAGQDFSFCAEMKENDYSNFIENVEECYQAYDPDYEASQWIGKDGHGQHGAPYHIKDLIEDMIAAKDMIWNLLCEFKDKTTDVFNIVNNSFNNK